MIYEVIPEAMQIHLKHLSRSDHRAIGVVVEHLLCDLSWGRLLILVIWDEVLHFLFCYWDFIHWQYEKLTLTPRFAFSAGLLLIYEQVL